MQYLKFAAIDDAGIIDVMVIRAQLWALYCGFTTSLIPASSTAANIFKDRMLRDGDFIGFMICGTFCSLTG